MPGREFWKWSTHPNIYGKIILTAKGNINSVYAYNSIKNWTEIKTVINEKFDKIELMKHQDEGNKDKLKKQLDSLRQDFLENNKLINHLFKEYKSLSRILQATVSPWLPQKSQNENSNLNINSSPVCKNFETPTKNQPQISKSNRGVPPNRLIINTVINLEITMEKWLPIN